MTGLKFQHNWRQATSQVIIANWSSLFGVMACLRPSPKPLPGPVMN